VTVKEEEGEKVVSLVVVVMDAQWEESQWRRQVKKVNSLIRGVSIGEETMRLIEGNITGNPNAMSNRIPTTIPLTLRVITKEDTLDWLDSRIVRLWSGLTTWRAVEGWMFTR
jgi:hypothetical protein